MISLIKKAILVIAMVFAGCAGESVQKEQHETKEPAEEIAAKIGLTDYVEVKSRVVKGAFFQSEDVDAVATVFQSAKEGDANLVGVFISDDTENVIAHLRTYLINLKNEMQYSHPDQVFKISNAVIESDDRMIILVVAENIEGSKSAARSVLGIEGGKK